MFNLQWVDCGYFYRIVSWSVILFFCKFNTVFISCESHKTKRSEKAIKHYHTLLRTQYNLINVTLLKRSNKGSGPHLKFLSGLKRHLNFLQFIKIFNLYSWRRIFNISQRMHISCTQPLIFEPCSIIRLTLNLCRDNLSSNKHYSGFSINQVANMRCIYRPVHFTTTALH